MVAQVHVVVYVGEPLDYARYRHTGVFVEFDDDAEGKGTLFHVTGAAGFFAFESRLGYDPRASKSLCKIIDVGKISAGVPRAAVGAILAATRVRNGIDEADWNCQNWVGDALQQLVAQKWVTAEQRENAVNEMVTVCLEARDE